MIQPGSLIGCRGGYLFIYNRAAPVWADRIGMMQHGEIAMSIGIVDDDDWVLVLVGSKVGYIPAWNVLNLSPA